MKIFQMTTCNIKRNKSLWILFEIIKNYEMESFVWDTMQTLIFHEKSMRPKIWYTNKTKPYRIIVHILRRSGDGYHQIWFISSQSQTCCFSLCSFEFTILSTIPRIFYMFEIFIFNVHCSFSIEYDIVIQSLPFCQYLRLD